MANLGIVYQVANGGLVAGKTPGNPAARILAIGEILWDVFDDSTRLGGASLNFTAHASRLGHEAVLVSAVGNDALGARALAAIEALGLSARLIGTTSRFPTGAASVELGPGGQPAFRIHRPAAYDAVELSAPRFEWIARWEPEWLYYGTLLFTARPARETLRRLIEALPRARRFYDVNLRPESYSSELVAELLSLANVVKLNETEMDAVAEIANLPRSSIAGFCQAGAARYGWDTACVTLGARGCAIWSGGEYVEAPGYPVEVADTVGAGDGFAAALLHGLARRDKLSEIARFANRVGAIVASRPGAIPDWNPREATSANP
ncbi:MAG: carbohydrate kinase [Bryobacteraceae bacterium]|jgi:fructokinase